MSNPFENKPTPAQQFTETVKRYMAGETLSECPKCHRVRDDFDCERDDCAMMARSTNSLSVPAGDQRAENAEPKIVVTSGQMNLILMAVEHGFREHERGKNLQGALASVFKLYCVGAAS